jgi:hypothetical protein
MIGVIADSAVHDVVSEFFELFKTPWEFYRSDRQYEVVLRCGDSDFDENAAKLTVVYTNSDRVFAVGRIKIASRTKDRMLMYNGTEIPLYRESVTFHGPPNDVLVDKGSRQPALHQEQFKENILVYVGYDLFHEVRFLLTRGQPTENAHIPTLELHIAVLRDLIVAAMTALVEIPPVPEGYRFIACLTHDVDHPSIRLHKFDHTSFGFLYRAVVGSLIDMVRGRRPLRVLLINWAAALKLPFVYLGSAKDCWSGFDRYLQIEKDARSSFFVIPFRDNPGEKEGRSAPKRRASRYAATDLTDQIGSLMSAGSEIGLHGIDAWCDSSRGKEELQEIRRLTGMRDIGVRIHWLYFNDLSPLILEQAGADYDSTVGYNDTIGYRAGTTQVYKPLGATRLLELPLHIMDTALFYPTHLDLSFEEAHNRVSGIIDNAARLGGCVTVNWHDRSIAPERCWDGFYKELIAELSRKGAWFATATEAVSWFRKRRSARFEGSNEASELHLKEIAGVDGHLPALYLKFHQERVAQSVSNHNEVSGCSLASSAVGLTRTVAGEDFKEI